MILTLDSDKSHKQMNSNFTFPTDLTAWTTIISYFSSIRKVTFYLRITLPIVLWVPSFYVVLLLRCLILHVSSTSSPSHHQLFKCPSQPHAPLQLWFHHPPFPYQQKSPKSWLNSLHTSFTFPSTAWICFHCMNLLFYKDVCSGSFRNEVLLRAHPLCLLCSTDISAFSLFPEIVSSYTAILFITDSPSDVGTFNLPTEFTPIYLHSSFASSLF